MIAKFADRAGLDDVSPHTLRHSFAKNLVDADVGLETTRLYTQPSKADLQAATEKMGSTTFNWTLAILIRRDGLTHILW